VSDNQEQDIGSVGGTVDFVAVRTFLGESMDGRVVTVYDQSGAGNDLVQSTPENQPTIDADDATGTFVMVNGSLNHTEPSFDTYNMFMTDTGDHIPSGQGSAGSSIVTSLTFPTSLYALRSSANSTTIGNAQSKLQKFVYTDTPTPTPSAGAPSYTVSTTEVVNVYASITTSTSVGGTVLNVNDAAGFSAGDHIWIYQVQNGASLEVGYHETALIATVDSATQLTLSSGLQRAYSSGTPNARPSYTAQIVKIAEYDTLTVDGTVKSTPWNGEKGGVVYIRCNAIDGAGSIDVSAQGFRGGHYGTGNNSPGYEGEGIYGCGSATTVSGRVTGRANTSNSYAFQNPSGGNNTGGAPGEPASHSGSGGGGGGHVCRGTLGRCRYTHYNMGGFAAPISSSQIFFGGGGSGGGDDDGRTSNSWGGHGGGIVIIEASQCLIPVKSNGQDNATIYRGTDAQAKGSGGAGGTIILFSSDIEEVSVSGGNGYTRYDPIGGDGSAGRVIIKQYKPSGQIRVPNNMPVQAVSYQDLVSLISVSRRDLVVNSGKTSITDQASGQEWDFGGSAALVLEDGVPCLDLTAGALTLNGAGATMGQEYTLIYYWKPIVGPNIWRTLHRSDNVDHLVIVNTGATDLGMYSNRNGKFRDTGYNITPGVWQTLIVTSIGDSPTSSTGTGTFFVNDENVGTVDRVGSGTQIKTISYVESDGDFQSPGYIAAAGIFNRILSRKEITRVHRLLEKWGKGRYTQRIPKSVGQLSYLYYAILLKDQTFLQADMLGVTATSLTTWDDFTASSALTVTTDGPVPYISFDRALSQYMDGGSQTIQVSQGFTVMCVVRFTSPGNYERIIDFGSGAYNKNILISRQLTNSTLYFGMVEGSSWSTDHYIEGVGFIVDNEWIVLTAVYSSVNQEFYLYKDGSLFSQENAPITHTDRTVTNTLVADSFFNPDRTPQYSSAYFEGDMKYIGVWEQALSSEDVGHMYTYFKHKYGID